MTTSTVETLQARLLQRLTALRNELAVALADLPPDAPLLEGDPSSSTKQRLLADLDHSSASMALDLALHIVSCVEAFVEAKTRPAVLDRECLGDRWLLEPPPHPTPNGSQVGWAAVRVLRDARARLGRAPAELLPSPWPTTGEAAPLDVAQWARAAANAVLTGFGDALLAATQSDEPALPNLVGGTWQGQPFSCPAHALALIYLAVRDVEHDRQRRFVPISANRLARAALQVISSGPTSPGIEKLVTNEVPGRYVLYWKGATPVQLVLPQLELGAAALRGILEGLHEDGARDWLLLHRLAADQGRTGKFVWTWAEHRQRSAYARRLRQKNVRDEELQRAVSDRLRWLARAEIRAYTDVTVRNRGEKPRPSKAWHRVGPHGLIDIPAGIDSFSGLEAAEIRINEALYSGAARDGGSFALVGEAALDLDGSALRLAAMLAFDRWYARDQGGTLIRTAGNLWEASTLRGGDPAPKLRERAALSLERILDRLGEAGELAKWTRLTEGPVSSVTRYELTPPSWWTIQVVHRLPPALPTSTAGLPRSGADLRAWRERHGLAQRDAARQLGVGQATISRAEAAAKAPLSPTLLGKLVALATPSVPLVPDAQEGSHRSI